MMTAERLAADYHLRLWKFAWRQLGDEDAARDVAQEALQRTLAAVARQSVRDEERLSSFLFQTARHVCFRYIRSRQREWTALTQLRYLRPKASPENQIESELVNAQQLADLRNALQKLTTGDRDLLRLLYDEQLAIEEVAQKWSMKASTLRVRKHRLLSKLRRELERLPLREGGGKAPSPVGRERSERLSR